MGGTSALVSVDALQEFRIETSTYAPEFGRAPGQLFDERNLVAHLDEFEGDPARRPLTVDELDAFFGACDERIARARTSGRKGTLQAWRDQAMFKIKFT